MKTLVCAIGGACVWVTAALSAYGQGAADTITLAAAIELALRHNPQVVQAEATVENAGTARRSAVGSFLPTLSLGSGASLASAQRFDPATQRVVTGSEDAYNATLSLGYDLFTGGRHFAELSRARADLGAAEAARESQRWAVILRTETLFFDALRQAELLELARARVRRAEESLTMVRRRVEVGTATRSDTLRARLELANARQAVIQAEALTRAARFAMARQVGREAPVVPRPPDDLAPSSLLLSEQEILAQAEQVSPAVRAAEGSRAAATASVTSARTAYLPSLRFSSGYDWFNEDPALNGGRTSWSVRLSLSYPLFNGFVREGNVDRAEVAERVARIQEEDARLQARVDADRALQALRTAEQAIVLAEEALRVAEEDLRVVNERYRVGVVTLLEVLTSQINLDQAGVNLIAARYDYALARAELEAILGRRL
ncbi:MAG: TolC family protein [Gemmatimonadetes bacterium]|nr:TolC family protein [Gemmatimonadota bacterium]